MIFDRDPANPLLVPNEDSPWQSFAAFNPSLVKGPQGYHMVYRAIGNEQHVHNQHLRLSTIGHAFGDDGIKFSDGKPLVSPSEPFDRFGCEDPRITFIDGKYYIFYTALSGFPFGPENIRVAVAITDDLKTIEEKHPVTPFNAKAFALFPEKINGQYTAILSMNTDIPPSQTLIVQTPRIQDFWDINFWEEVYADRDKHALHLERISSDHIENGAVPVLLDEGWLIIYAHIRNYNTDKVVFGTEAVLLDKDDPHKILRRTYEPLFFPEKDYEVKGTVNDVIFPTCVMQEGSKLKIYYGGADTVVAAGTVDKAELLDQMEEVKVARFTMDKYHANPIITPNSYSKWENMSTYNPGALMLNGKVHIVYRGQNFEGTSVMGLAISRDGYRVNYRATNPIYVPRMPFEQRPDQGFCGCEDPRLHVFNDKIYMLYTAYDGRNPPCVALTHIDVADFEQRNWHMWSLPVIITDPSDDNKDCTIFPEKINGKYLFVHRISPNMQFCYRDSLEFGEDDHLTIDAEIKITDQPWEKLKIGANNPPFKTDEGWLLLYHGVGSEDHNYRLGCLLLDLDDPTKVIGRSRDPILEPTLEWERKGLVDNVVFPCGWVHIGDELFTYYGCADSSTGVATMKVKDIVEYLKSPQCRP